MPSETAPSFNSLVRDLRRGETASRTERIPLDSPAAKDVTTVLGDLRRTVNAAVSRIREKTGSNFRVESASALTADNGAILATVAVTRI